MPMSAIVQMIKKMNQEARCFFIIVVLMIIPANAGYGLTAR